MMQFFKVIGDTIKNVGEALFFLRDILWLILRGRVRFGEVLSQMYAQGVQSIIIIMMVSMAAGMVLAMQGYITLQRFGATEFIPRLVALSLLRELSPVFTALIFSGKAGAGMTAELGTMSTNDQIQATRAMGVDPFEFLVLPRFIACVLVLPVLIVISEIVGIWGGYMITVHDAHFPGAFYIKDTMQAIGYVDFFSGFIKAVFFAILVGWICCYQGFFTKGGALGVGRFTTQAVAYSYITIIISDVFLTKLILTLWG